jgi:hypothetical protein
MAVISVFRPELLLFQVAPHLYSRARVDPVPDFSENLVALGIEPGPLDL